MSYESKKKKINAFFACACGLVCYNARMTKEHYEIGQEEHEEMQEAFEELEAEREREASLVLHPDVFPSDWE